MAVVVDIVRRCGLSNDVHRRNQPKLHSIAVVTYTLLIQFYFISNKTKCLSCKGGCGMHAYGHFMHIDAFKRRGTLGYR